MKATEEAFLVLPNGLSRMKSTRIENALKHVAATRNAELVDTVLCPDVVVQRHTHMTQMLRRRSIA